MRNDSKSFISMLLMLAFLLALIYAARCFPVFDAKPKEEEPEGPLLSELDEEALLASYEEAEKSLLLWYTDVTMEPFFQKAVLDYYRETGLAVQMEERDPLLFLEQVYDASIAEEGEAPDLYFTGGDVLEEACLMGIAAEQEDSSEMPPDIAETARDAALLRGQAFGYPICFDTPVFVYLTEAFPEEPESLEAILDYAAEVGLKIEVGNILEWDLADEFYDLAFLGDCYTFSDEKTGSLLVDTDEAILAKKMDFLRRLSETITLDAGTISEGTVVSRLNHQAAASIIMDSDDLSRITVPYGVLPLIPLTDSLSMRGCAVTDMLFVNALSSESDEAAAFADFCMWEETEAVHELTPHYSVSGKANQDGEAQIVFEAYEKAAPLPHSMDSEDFLKTLRTEIIKLF